VKYPPPLRARARTTVRRFLIAGGLYSITTLRKTGAEETVYSKHQDLKQASKQAPQPRQESLVATEAIDKFVFAMIVGARSIAHGGT
jgi:hypothetical protein